MASGGDSPAPGPVSVLPQATSPHPLPDDTARPGGGGSAGALAVFSEMSGSVKVRMSMEVNIF